MHPPWNNWYHCTGNTYGTWLPGDPRGFRTWKHTKHIEGDYKNPPPKNTHDQLHLRSKKLMKRFRVILTIEQRKLACRAMVAALHHHAVHLLALAIGPKHFHILARFQPTPSHPLPAQIPLAPTPPSRTRTPRHLVGIAKKESARTLSKSNLLPEGGAWGKRCRPRPIKDRSHQIRVVNYIRKHVKEGCVVYSNHQYLIPKK